MTAGPLGLGVVGAGGFARFLLTAAGDLPDVHVAAVTDTDRDQARRLAAEHGAHVADDLPAMLGRSDVEAVVIATTPDSHADLAIRALTAGRHVFCEKPVALTAVDADRIHTAVRASGRVFVVDHVLRYNPILVAVRRLQDAGLLGSVQRLSFENDAADEDLPDTHWFWNETVSGGILLEHGVHFFDAAALLIAAVPHRVQAIAGRRRDGRIDTVVCTVEHADGALATYAHGFSHPRRAERQLWRLDCGLAEARIHGWIPLRADLDIWADDDTVAQYEQLPDRAGQLFAVPGLQPTGTERIAVTVARDAAPAATRSRGITHGAPHHLTAVFDIDGPDAKTRVYRNSLRAALLDLATSVRTGSTPRADITAGRAAVRLAAAATAALHDTTTHHVPTPEPSCPSAN